MSDVFDDAKKFADDHEKQVDQGLDNAGHEADQHTGGTYDDQIDKGVDAAEKHVGDGDPGNN